MKITKLEHCCLLLETNGKTILTDPGVFVADQLSELPSLDLLLITHEHADHLHVPAVAALRDQHPELLVVCNQAVGKLLDDADIPYTVLEGRQQATHAGVTLRAWDGPHAEIYQAVGQVQATGYLIDETVFLPGDSWSVPDYTVPTLALPVAGPWCRIADAITFALAVQPQTVFPVHDGLLNETGQTITYQHPKRELSAAGIHFVALADGESFTC